MTKADRIRQLAKHEIFTDAEIHATIVKEFGSCAAAYVRVCARQRVKGMSEHDRRYLAKPRVKKLVRARQRKYARDFAEKHGCDPSTDWARRKFGGWSHYSKIKAKRLAKSRRIVDRTNTGLDARGA